MPTPTPELRALLAAHAETVMRTLGAACVAVARWERDRGRLRTLLNAGTLAPGAEAFPAEEVYPLDTFPATDALLRFGRPYVDPPDVASTAVLAQMEFASQAAVPIVVEGSVWGALWAATGSGGRPLSAADLVTLARGADAAGRLLAAHGEA